MHFLSKVFQEVVSISGEERGLGAGRGRFKQQCWCMNILMSTRCAEACVVGALHHVFVCCPWFTSVSFPGFPAVALGDPAGCLPSQGGSAIPPQTAIPPRRAAPNDILNTSQRGIIKTAAIGPTRACRGGLFQNNEYGNSASVMNCKQSSNSLVPKIHTCLSHNLSLFFYYYCSICKQGQETLCSFVPPYICPLIPVSLPSPQHRQDYTKQKSLIFISDYLWAF